MWTEWSGLVLEVCLSLGDEGCDSAQSGSIHSLPQENRRRRRRLREEEKVVGFVAIPGLCAKKNSIDAFQISGPTAMLFLIVLS